MDMYVKVALAGRLDVSAGEATGARDGTGPGAVVGSVGGASAQPTTSPATRAASGVSLTERSMMSSTVGSVLAETIPD
jgi:hypothetical protein